MCRWAAWKGDSIFLSRVVAEPCRSLIHQSLHAAEANSCTNGDGLGVGWYGERPEPGLYRELRPAWSDDNLAHLVRQIRSPLFFAHVRASTGGAGSSRANCHPFAHGRHMFMHNGQIGGWQAVRRAIEALIPDGLYPARIGTTDSEALFLAILGRGATADPLAAVAAVLADTLATMAAAGVDEPLRFTTALSDGRDLWAVRFASDDKPPSLYFRETATGLLVVSEPIDDEREGWHPVPADHALIARDGRPVELRPFTLRQRLAA
jgi:glutamine amidotransferase